MAVNGGGVGPHLLGRNTQGDGSQVHLLVRLYAGQHQEQTWTLSPSWQKSAQPEDDSSLVLQHYLGSRQDYHLTFVCQEYINS